MFTAAVEAGVNTFVFKENHGQELCTEWQGIARFTPIFRTAKDLSSESLRTQDLLTPEGKQACARIY